MAALSWDIWGAKFTARQKAGGSQISHRYSQGMLGREVKLIALQLYKEEVPGVLEGPFLSCG